MERKAGRGDSGSGSEVCSPLVQRLLCLLSSEHSTVVQEGLLFCTTNHNPFPFLRPQHVGMQKFPMHSLRIHTGLRWFVHQLPPPKQPSFWMLMLGGYGSALRSTCCILRARFQTEKKRNLLDCCCRGF